MNKEIQENDVMTFVFIVVLYFILTAIRGL